MSRTIAAVLFAPIGALVGAWLGQYIVPSAALGYEVIINGDVTYRTGSPAPLPAIAFFAPTKLSIPLTLATYSIASLIALPLGAFLVNRGKATLVAAAAIGAAVAIATMMAIGLILPVTADALFRGRAYAYGGFIGFVAGAWYWCLAHGPIRPSSPNPRLKVLGYMGLFGIAAFVLNGLYGIVNLLLP